MANRTAWPLAGTGFVLELLRYEPSTSAVIQPNRAPRWFLMITRGDGGPELVSMEASPALLTEIEDWCAKARELIETDGGRLSAEAPRDAA